MSWRDNNEIPVGNNWVWKFILFLFAVIVDGFSEICSDTIAPPPPEKDKSRAVIGIEWRGYSDCIQPKDSMQIANIDLHIFITLFPVHLF